MLLTKKAKIEAMCGRDETRVHLMAPYLDLTEDGKPQLVATDGHALIAIEVQVSDADVTGFVSLEALKAARKMGPRAEIACNGTCALPNGATFPRPNDGTFPDWRQVMPGNREDEKTIAFDVRLLKSIVEAAGGDGRVKITFADPCDPFKVEVLGADVSHRAVLMPIRP